MRESGLMVQLKDYKYNEEDCDDVFYIVLKLSTEPTPTLIFKLL